MYTYSYIDILVKKNRFCLGLGLLQNPSPLSFPRPSCPGETTFAGTQSYDPRSRKGNGGCWDDH